MQGAKAFWLSAFFQKTTGFSSDSSRLSRNKRFPLGNGQPLHEPAKFLLRKFLQLYLASWPLEPFFRQALGQQGISCANPIQRFDAIYLPSAEQIERRLIHFLPELGLYQCSQVIDLLAHVRITAGNVVILYTAEIKYG